MNLFKALPFFFVVFLTFVSCEEDKGTDIDIIEYNDIIITLDKGTYKPEESARLTIHNNTEKDLVLLNCGTSPGFDLQKRIVGKWNNVYLLECPAIGLPFEILAGDKKEFDIALPPLTLKPSEVEGEYRLLLWLKDKQSNQFLEQSERATDSFRMTN
ncbi:hypothetical protein ACX8XN_18945 [Calditrichota bacterium GD2]